MSREVFKGRCAICGEYKRLSFEHVPPKSCFNNKPIFMHYGDDVFNLSSRGRKVIGDLEVILYVKNAIMKLAVGMLMNLRSGLTLGCRP